MFYFEYMRLLFAGPMFSKTNCLVSKTKYTISAPIGTFKYQSRKYYYKIKIGHRHQGSIIKIPKYEQYIIFKFLKPAYWSSLNFRKCADKNINYKKTPEEKQR